MLSLTLRAIFNLFLHFKRHLKVPRIGLEMPINMPEKSSEEVQLEIFFTSVHLKIAGAAAEDLSFQ